MEFLHDLLLLGPLPFVLYYLGNFVDWYSLGLVENIGSLDHSSSKGLLLFEAILCFFKSILELIKHLVQLSLEVADGRMERLLLAQNF